MTIIEDVAQKENKHKLKNNYWKSSGIEVIRHPLPVGDYILMNDKVRDVIERKEKRGIPVKKMDFLGTYNVCVDSKFGIQELVSDICGKQHERFRDQCILSQNNGIKLYILVEDDGGYCDKKETIYNKPVACIDDLFSWKNPRTFIWAKGKQKYPTATKGATLAKACLTMKNKYSVEFIFCKSKDSGKEIVRLLNEKEVKI